MRQYLCCRVDGATILVRSGRPAFRFSPQLRSCVIFRLHEHLSMKTHLWRAPRVHRPAALQGPQRDVHRPWGLRRNEYCFGVTPWTWMAAAVLMRHEPTDDRGLHQSSCRPRSRAAAHWPGRELPAEEPALSEVHKACRRFRGPSVVAEKRRRSTLPSCGGTRRRQSVGRSDRGQFSDDVLLGALKGLDRDVQGPRTS